MDTASLHSPVVRQLVEAINGGSLNDFMAVFAPDATVVDGPAYYGLQVIQDWAQRENFGVHMHFDVVRENNPEGTLIEVNATSTGGYSGPSTFAFTIRNGLIERFEIS